MRSQAGPQHAFIEFLLDLRLMTEKPAQRRPSGPGVLLTGITHTPWCRAYTILSRHVRSGSFRCKDQHCTFCGVYRFGDCLPPAFTTLYFCRVPPDQDLEGICG